MKLWISRDWSSGDVYREQNYDLWAKEPQPDKKALNWDGSIDYRASLGRITSFYATMFEKDNRLRLKPGEKRKIRINPIGPVYEYK